MRAVHVGGAVAALPGGSVAVQAPEIGTTSTAAVAGLADQLDAQGGRLGTAATAYLVADAAVTGAIQAALAGAR